MQGNLHHLYQLRQDRIRRIHESFNHGRINQRQYLILLSQEGYDPNDSFRSIGEAAKNVVERLK